jgi:hypothetical protein
MNVRNLNNPPWEVDKREDFIEERLEIKNKSKPFVKYIENMS